jgi:VWFA-related protein
MRQSRILPVIFLGLVFAAMGTGLSHAASPASEAAAAPNANGNSKVTLDVVVAAKSGAPVSGLQAADFTLLDNNSPQTLSSFQAAGGMVAKADPPVELILVLDALNTGVITVDKARQSLPSLFREDGGVLPLPTSLIVLSDRGFTIQDHPTRDGRALMDFLTKNTTGLREHRGNGWEIDTERRDLSLRALRAIVAEESKRPGRKLVVWIGRGWASLGTELGGMSDKWRHDEFIHVVELSDALRQAHMTLYSVDPQGVGIREHWEDSVYKGVSSEREVNYASLVLEVLARQTGGLELEGSNDIAQMVHRCIADANAYYVLTFNPPAAAHANEYHGIEVKVNKPGLTARTRAGYYAQP